VVPSGSESNPSLKFKALPLYEASAWKNVGTPLPGS